MQERRVDCLGLTETQSDMQCCLYERLHQRQPISNRMDNVAYNARTPVCNGSPELSAKQDSDFVERQRGRPRKRVCFFRMRKRIDQRVGGNRGEVARVDEGDASIAGGDVDSVIVTNVAQVGTAQVLHEKAGPKDSPSRRTRAEMHFDRMMWHDRIGGGPRNRNEDDLPDALGAGHIDQPVQGASGIRDGRRAQQEDGIASRDGTAIGIWFQVIKLDAVPRAARFSGKTRANTRTRRNPPLTEEADHLAANVPAGTRDEDRFQDQGGPDTVRSIAAASSGTKNGF